MKTNNKTTWKNVATESGQIIACFMSSATEREKQAAPAAWMERAPILERVEIKVYTLQKIWITPYFGARELWREYCPAGWYPKTADELESWALTARPGDCAALQNVTFSIYSR